MEENPVDYLNFVTDLVDYKVLKTTLSTIFVLDTISVFEY